MEKGFLTVRYPIDSETRHRRARLAWAITERNDHSVRFLHIARDIPPISSSGIWFKDLKDHVQIAIYGYVGGLLDRFNLIFFQ